MVIINFSKKNWLDFLKCRLLSVPTVKFFSTMFWYSDFSIFYWINESSYVSSYFDIILLFVPKFPWYKGITLVNVTTWPSVCWNDIMQTFHTSKNPVNKKARRSHVNLSFLLKFIGGQNWRKCHLVANRRCVILLTWKKRSPHWFHHGNNQKYISCTISRIRCATWTVATNSIAWNRAN